VNVRPPPRYPANDQVRPYPPNAHEVALGHDRPTSHAGALRDMPPLDQDETSDNQLIARWRSRARSPMSMPVVVAICSIGVLMRSSTE
jgi:hypothetical protein